MQDPLASWATIATAIVTLFVAILTLINTLIAKDSLKIMQQQEKRRHPFLELYYVASFVKRFHEQKFRIYAINLRISNRSDSDNSLKELNLIIQLARNIGPSSSIAFSHVADNMSSIAELVGKTVDEIIKVPTSIKAYEVIKGWALFQVNDEILQNDVDVTYEVKVIDAHNVESSLELMIIHEK